ncbi:MAG TPA: dephospho-CoA kinase [Bryobacteraceae bacterium]|nr:dephospho-CoA kinase [Bryobacteraceae bacterium]
MLRVGLTGGLASGKSFVARELAGLGCYLIEADKLGHEVMLPGGEAYDGIVREFGREILDAGGRIDRRRLGAIVFANPERLAKLTALVHPPVQEREEAMMAEIARRDPRAIAVVEAAILVETGRYKSFDRLIVVTCTPEQQMERALERGSYTREEVAARLGRQLPLEEKVKVADYVIDTSGDKASTLEQVRKVFGELRSLTA